MIWLALLLGGAIPFSLYLWLRPEGEFTPARAMTGSGLPPHDALALRLLSWNVLQSQDSKLGKPWALRKESFRILRAGWERGFEVICLQEALPDQLSFFASILPAFEMYAAGRDDGQSAGEHCPIFYDAAKYRLCRSGTFWLSPTPERPGSSWGENVPRICSWVELQSAGEDGGDARARFCVFNVHLHLNPFAQPKAAWVLAEKIRELGVDEAGKKIPCIVAGDFNAPHRWPALRVLERCGLSNAETSGARTYHLRGKGIRCLDHILIDEHWGVTAGGVVREKGGTVYPSDHFGLWAELSAVRSTRVAHCRS